MNYDLFPVVGSLSFLYYVPRISHTHTHTHVIIPIYYIIYYYVPYTPMAVSTNRDLRNTLWREKNSPASRLTVDEYVFTLKQFSSLIIPIPIKYARLNYAIGFRFQFSHLSSIIILHSKRGR